MGSFKSGSGNLDFGSSDQDDATEQTTDQTSGTTTEQTESPPEDNAETASAPAETTAEPSESTTPTEQESESTAADDYPYFVRRSNVTDERDVRLEVHVREQVASQESQYRNDLADALDTDSISKTDAREFALRFAFQNPEKVAELLRDEGFGVLG